MRVNKKFAILLLLILYAVFLYFWFQPISEYPFGDVDSSLHFGLGDYISYSDHSYILLPEHISAMAGPVHQGKAWYPPQFHTNAAVMQVLGGARVQSYYSYIAILSSIVILALLFLVYHLWGFFPAILSSILMAFSTRDISVYLWAQWAQAISYAFIPVIAYCLYQYVHLYHEGKLADRYLWVLVLLTAIQFQFHPQGTAFVTVLVGVYFALTSWYHRKISFSFKKASLAALVFILLIAAMAPFQMRTLAATAGLIDLGEYQESLSISNKEPFTFSRLFEWYSDRMDGPAGYVPYASSYGGYWTLPFLLLGLCYLLFKRSPKEILIISGVISLYFVLHLDIIGKGGRLHRMLGIEFMWFAIIIALGFLFINTLLRKISFLKGIPRVWILGGLGVLFLLFAFFQNIQPGINALSNAYPGIMRVTPEQYEVTQWMQNQQDNYLWMVGVLVPAKAKMMGMLAYKTPVYDYKFFGFESKFLNKSDYIMIDYSDARKANRADLIQQLQYFETAYPKNTSKMDAQLIYEKNDIKVYKIDGIKVQSLN